MQVIVKTNYNNKEANEVIEPVTSVMEFGRIVAINIKYADGAGKTQYIGLDGHTELIIR